MPLQTSATPSSRLVDSARIRRRGRRPLISLTPLIDVVFILLVFFMLASSFLDWRSIDLTAPSPTVAGSSTEGSLLVEVRADSVRLSGAPVSLDELAARVGERLVLDPDQRVLVRPATGVPLQEVVTVLDRLSDAGVVDMSLIRDPGR